jgi:glycosyltransferase involved in cell wall biosynthesis
MALWERWRDAFDLVVANSDWVRRRLRAEGLDVGRRIWNGVPTRPARPPLASPPTVAFAGRLVPNKGVDVLLRAVAGVAERLPDVRLLVAGDGPERDRLRALAASLGVAARVEWLGHLSRERVEERFAAAWVQAAPSNWEEPFGLVAAEGMMRGSAVVASRIGGLSEIVDEGRTGLLVPPGDADALAAALLDVLGDRTRAEAMGRLGRERALAYFSERSVVDQFLEVYEELRRPASTALALSLS